MSVTILIPTYNMGEHLPPLLDSIEQTGLASLVDEIVVINDGSTDGTPSVLEEYQKVFRFEGKLRILQMERNSGRFRARLAGASLAQSEWVLFLDSRLTLAENFAVKLNRVLNRGNATVGWVETDVNRNVYALYWQRLHEKLFALHYSLHNPLELTQKNYDDYLKGTGVFVCKRQDFLDACRAFENQKIKSDDTLLLREMLRFDRLWIDPSLKVHWQPRGRLLPFLLRFIERGPSFVEYHVFAYPGRFARIVWGVLMGILIWLALLVVTFQTGGLGPGSSILLTLPIVAWLTAASTAFYLGRDSAENRRLFALHGLVILFFGIGVLKGLAQGILRARAHWPAKYQG